MIGSVIHVRTSNGEWLADETLPGMYLSGDVLWVPFGGKGGDSVYGFSCSAFGEAEGIGTFYGLLSSSSMSM